MEITGLISALVIGVIIGGLGRLVVPGRQKISMVMTLLVGIAAALVGTFAASLIGVSDTSGIDWIELALQVGLAGLGVTTLARRRTHQPH
ncbi:GlsB/YeaQ/YmgE family stress response membrane protein [Saccharothrix sp. S26]|uniref:GlsB/YeaQ/YmgE family stress response membrane protein n=1 Tax=Saccharothrix sp. S26 TaxID=2907215 RepID=UPI001F41A892|nr:GlsB/YeaQ/YmgE family stress response membrane protein [Saccharothrix sp. S26]MCE6993447.1 GlsB/YeaQ/YmgE family stress response membrane protein [Saccharothrix sp. S26]